MAMMRNATIFACAVFAAVSLPVTAATGRNAISAEQVAAALSQRGISASADQITLLSNVLANTANPDLKVKSVERLDDHRAAARLECARPDQCVPFVVTVRLDREVAGVQELPAGSQQQAIAVRSGSLATLHLDGVHVHVKLTVICLENGSIGQKIRATSSDRRQVYMVRVADNGLLEGAL
jgi:hypothetical protein